ncbi:MAG: heme-binding protein, partial [Cyclobacteriaceae bacterium]|nr:heme-binding protein [Cyclobacteriaceae bacterium]
MKTIVRSLPFSLMAGLCIIIFWSCKKSPSEPVDLRIKQMDHEEVRKMASEIESTMNPTLKDGLSMSLWAVDSLIVDPISIDMDEYGTLYYTSSDRLGKVEFDIRGHQNWEIESISLQSVEDKRAFLRKELSLERSQENTWLKDFNGDGSHDWRDMLVIKESVYQIKDTNGDGLADWSQKMIEDFHEEVTDIAAAVLKHEDDLFVGVGPDFWRLKDKNGDGVIDEK